MSFVFRALRTALIRENRRGSLHPEIYPLVTVPVGTVSWGLFILGRKATNELPVLGHDNDMSAVSGTSEVVDVVRHQNYHLSKQLEDEEITGMADARPPPSL